MCCHGPRSWRQPQVRGCGRDSLQAARPSACFYAHCGRACCLRRGSRGVRLGPGLHDDCAGRDVPGVAVRNAARGAGHESRRLRQADLERRRDASANRDACRGDAHERPPHRPQEKRDAVHPRGGLGGRAVPTDHVCAPVHPVLFQLQRVGRDRGAELRRLGRARVDRRRDLARVVRCDVSVPQSSGGAAPLCALRVPQARARRWPRCWSRRRRWRSWRCAR
eukprot:Amastigsp_a3018_24.p3 type:complete len:222 gc:universal Amastigsp_a3018_24:365-1030(+)